MIKNGGYIFVCLCRCKVYDRFFYSAMFPSQCIRSLLEYISYNSSSPAKCGKCHETDNRKFNLFRCVKCGKAEVGIRGKLMQLTPVCVLSYLENKIRYKTVPNIHMNKNNYAIPVQKEPSN